MGDGSLPEGVTLARSPLGGHVVLWDGEMIGWIHPGIGEKWTAYLRNAPPCPTGTPLGCFRKPEAIRKIATAAGWPGRRGKHSDLT